MSAVFTEVFKQYRKLNPKDGVHPYVLMGMLNRLEGNPGRQAMGLAASLALELARHPRVPPEDRYDYSLDARSRFTARSKAGEYILQGNHAQMTRAHLPLFLPDNLTDARSTAIGNAGELMKEWRGRYWSADGVISRGETGYAYELGICLLGNAMEPSILAYPSLLRQDINAHPIAGKAYKWDVTVESDGTVINEGQYRVQVKSSTNAGREAYHPDIHVLRVGDLLPQREDVYLLPELLGNEENLYDTILTGAISHILDKLSAKEPASRQMTYMN
jgi:hypothetical protein